MATRLNYHHLLVRTQHPAYRKDFTGVPEATASFHLVLNYLIANQLLKLQEKIQKLEGNSFPHTADSNGLSRYETDYFDFTKPNLNIDQRRDELLKWINSKVGMSLPDVINACVSITGKTPLVVVKVNKGAWVLGKARLGITTIMGGGDTTANRYTYLVKFSEIIGTTLLQTLDSELTRIEKGGSKHIISAPKVKWILGESRLGVDTILRI